MLRSKIVKIDNTYYVRNYKIDGIILVAAIDIVKVTPETVGEPLYKCVAKVTTLKNGVNVLGGDAAIVKFSEGVPLYNIDEKAVRKLYSEIENHLDDLFEFGYA